MRSSTSLPELELENSRQHSVPDLDGLTLSDRSNSCRSSSIYSQAVDTTPNLGAYAWTTGQKDALTVHHSSVEGGHSGLGFVDEERGREDSHQIQMAEAVKTAISKVRTSGSATDSVFEGLTTPRRVSCARAETLKTLEGRGLRIPVSLRERVAHQIAVRRDMLRRLRTSPRSEYQVY